MLRTTDRFVVRKIYGTAYELTQNEKRAKEFAADVQLTPDELKTVPELAEKCAMQYGLMGEHAPAIFLGIFMIGYAGRSLYALQQLKEIAELNAAAKRPAAAAVPSVEKIVQMPPTDANSAQKLQTPNGGN